MSLLIAPETLRTDRFMLRSYLPGDGPALAEAKAGSYEHLAPWIAWASAAEAVEDDEALARTFRARWLLAENWVMGIFSPDESRMLGGTGFHPRSGGVGTGTVEIGMWIRVEEAGRGLGTAVLTEMLRWGFTDWPWQRLEWRCDAANLASARTAQKAGMRLEGTLRGEHDPVSGGRRDQMIHGLLRDDPRPAPPAPT